MAALAGSAAVDPGRLARQWREYQAERPKSVLELQPFRRTSTMAIRGHGGRRGIATLIEINPRINQWYVLELAWSDGRTEAYHLENGRPGDQDLRLDPAQPEGIVLVARDGLAAGQLCSFRGDALPTCEAGTGKPTDPFVCVCDGSVHLRQTTAGSRTSKEWAANFVRKKFWQGEAIEAFVRDQVYDDAFLETGSLAEGVAASPPPDGPDYPLPARTLPERAADRLRPLELGIAYRGGGPMAAGRWYPATDVPGVFLSTIVPSQVAGGAELDRVERDAVVDLIAFDLTRFDLGFELGTDQPDVDWSERVPPARRNPLLPGPDGIRSTEPLAPTGFLPPRMAEGVVATFAGGFKRRHGAFRTGALAQVNRGSHYGFVVGGAVLSKLQPGLATLFGLDDGRVEMKTWTAEDDAVLERLRFARQNGVAILEREPGTDKGVPGPLIGRWGEGNWAGGKDSKLRSVRAAAALQARGGRRFLLYAYFSSATPLAMARVLEAYGCEYAMHLDMNALEHTYLALYHAEGGKLGIEHLIRGMSALEKSDGRVTIPRFLGYADNRDFFYVVRRTDGEARENR